MPIQIISLTGCPFCSFPSGKIILDVQKLAHLRKTSQSSSPVEIEAGNSQKIVRYNSNTHSPGPCQHLVDLLLTVAWAPKRDKASVACEWDACFTWLNPLVSQIDPGFNPRELLYDIVDQTRERKYVPQTPHHCSSFDHRWKDLTSHQWPEGHFEVEGNAIFSNDIFKLLQELDRSSEETASAPGN